MAARHCGGDRPDLLTARPRRWVRSAPETARGILLAVAVGGDPEPSNPAPVRRWLLPLTVVLLGMAIGLGAFTFVYAKGYSYLSNDPAVCANCHIMDEHYAAWLKSSHQPVAGCNDCHTPHDLVPKYVVKAKNGFWHSFYFTRGTFPYPLRITEGNRAVTEEACRYCHERLTATVDHAVAEAEQGQEPSMADAREAERLSCVRCHRHVGHWIR